MSTVAPTQRWGRWWERRGLDEGRAVRPTLGPSIRGFPGPWRQGLALDFTALKWLSNANEWGGEAGKAWASLAGEGSPGSLWQRRTSAHT